MPSHRTEFLIGQLLMADFPGTSVTPQTRDLIITHALGGVTLFQKNVEHPAQVAALCRDLQQVVAAAGLPSLLVAIDQEGGSVERLPLGMPGAMALGATGAAAYAERAGELTGRVLRAAGITVNFAPVLDVNTNPANPVIGTRSFGEDPALVSGLGRAYVRGLQRQGVMATAKHFPGHGDTDVDSHFDLPVVRHSRERLEAVEFAPFRAVSGEVAAIMTAHVAVVPMGMTPATLSPALLDGILRRDWRFEGVIFTDSLAMAAIVDHVGAGRAAVQALLAGADVLLALGGEQILAEVFAAVRQAVDDGVLSPARLEQSFRRLARVRAAMPAAGARGGEGSAGVADERALAVFAREVATAAVTLVRNDARTVPLPGGRVRVITLADGYGAGPTLGSALRRLRPEVEEIVGDPPGGQVDAAADETLIIVTHSHGRPDPRHVDVVRRAHARAGDRLVVVAAGTPYDLAAFPQISSYLATYGREAVMLEAAARLLVGEIGPRGRLPVSIPGCHPAGWGVVW